MNITVTQVYALTSNAEEAEWLYQDLQDLLELTPKKDVLFIIGDWNAKVGNQEIPGTMGNFGLGVQNEGMQSLTESCQENALSEQTPSSNSIREDSTPGHHQISGQYELIIFYIIYIIHIYITKVEYSLQSKMDKLYTVSKNKTGS